MDTVLYHGAFTVTCWTLVGWLGASGFAARWLVQLWHRKRSGSSTMPTSFWLISLISACLTLLYFAVGHPDSVGVLQNALPLALAGYNLYLDAIARRGASA
jgi:lipid-A-disaccharide synthase-like uncharacterized protein